VLYRVLSNVGDVYAIYSKTKHYMRHKLLCYRLMQQNVVSILGNAHFIHSKPVLSADKLKDDQPGACARNLPNRVPPEPTIEPLPQT
jgi:hypothetical protein